MPAYLFTKEGIFEERGHCRTYWWLHQQRKEDEKGTHISICEQCQQAHDPGRKLSPAEEVCIWEWIDKR